MAETLSIEQFTEEVAAQIASQLKIDTTALVKSLVDSLSKNLVDKIIVNKNSSFIPQEKSKQTQENKQQEEKRPNKSPDTLLSKTAEQALSKIPMLASVLVEIAKNTSNKSAKSPNFADIFTFENFYKKSPKLVNEFKTFTFKEMYANLPKGFERYFQSLKDVLNNGFKSFKPRENKEETNVNATAPSKTFLEKETPTDQRVLFDGFTQIGLEQFTKALPEIIKKSMGSVAKAVSASQDTTNKQNLGKGILSELKGLAGLAGLGALLFALQTDGPFKGIAKLASRGLLQVSGWTKLVDGFVGKFLNKLIKIPFKLIRNFEKSFAGLIGKEVGGTVIKTGLGKLTGFATRFLAGAMRVLKKVPFVGSLISIGMAFSRFKQGDVVGGGLEVLSGVANAFGLVPLSLAIDGLNAFLDYKAGGTPQGGGKGKGGMLLGWVHDLSNWIYKNFVKKIRAFPIVGPLVKAFDAFKAGQWKRGIKQLAYIFTPFEWIGELLGDQDTTGSGKKLVGAGFKIADMFKSLTSALMKKVKEWWKSISSGFRMLFEAVIPDDVKKDLNAVEPAEKPPIPKTTEPALTTSKISENAKPDQTVSQNNEETEPEDTSVTPRFSEQPLRQVFNDKSTEHLSKLVENSDRANQTMANLVVGFNTLARALEKLGISVVENGGNTTVINAGKGSAPVRASTAADYIKSGNSTISDFRNFIEQARQTTF